MPRARLAAAARGWPFLILLFAAGSRADNPVSDPFSRQGICAFAAHLEAEGEAASAAGELGRCLYLSEASDSSLHRELRARRIQALRRAGDPAQAARDYLAWARLDTAGVPGETALELARDLIRADQDSLALAVLDAPAPGARAGMPWARNRLLQGAAWLRLGALDSTRAALLSASGEGGKDVEPHAKLLGGHAEELRAGLGRSPWVAGALSAVVPGLGKAYAGRPMDGIATLVTLAFFGWQAWDGYAHDGPASVKGAIFAAAGTGLYLGNVHGSARAAIAETEKRRRAFADRVKFTVSFQLP